MNDTGLLLAQPAWLWGLLLIPVVLAWRHSTRPTRRIGKEQRYADAELLPWLLGEQDAGSRRPWRARLAWAAAWALLLLAMAGPRWGYQQISPYRPKAELVILLDISRSMDIDDVSPSRLGRAKQEIEDIARQGAGLSIGLIAFATTPHVVTPITEDHAAVLHQLPALSSDLVRLKGSRIIPALERAQQLLSASGDDISKHILILTDGDFADNREVGRVARRLAGEGIHLHVFGFGGIAGRPVPWESNLPLIGVDGRPVYSALNETPLQTLAEAGNGIYRRADYSDDDTRALLDRILERAGLQSDESQHTRVWNEYFWVPLLLAMLILLRLYWTTSDTRAET